MMKKITLVTKLIISILISSISIHEATAQDYEYQNWFGRCQQPLNISDSLELVKIFGKANADSFDDWFYFGFVDTLGECRVNAIGLTNFNIYAETDTQKLEITNFSFLRYIEFELIGFNELVLSNLPLLENINIHNNVWVNKKVIMKNLPRLKTIDARGFSVEGWDLDSLPYIDKIEMLGSDLGDISHFTSLSNLKSLILRGNTFDQDITHFKNIPMLKELNLDGNQLTGEILNFENLPLLEKLDLSGNQFTGKIPNFQNIPFLKEIKLSHNQLTDIIPNFDNLPLLDKLELCGGDNDFIGPIPTLENCPLLNINDVDFSCVRPAPEPTGCIISESDSLELVNFYQTTNGENWQINTGWLTENMTSWWGIDFVDTLGKCRVNKILIRGIPDAVELPTLNLPFLKELILDYNNFTGAIPDLSNLTNLKTLNLGNNNFEGDLPDLNTFTQLEELNLSSNQLIGTLPDFSNNPLLRTINLSSNLVTGTVTDFQTIPNLNYVNVADNQLNGFIPNFTNLSNLYTLNVAQNELTDGLPNFSNLPVLQSLFVEDNQLSGRIPNFNNMPLLEELIVCDNNFEGTAPNFSFSPLLNVDAIDFSCLQAAKVSGYAYYDANNNCIYDEGDLTLPNGLVSLNNGANYQPIDENGYYEIALEVGTSVITFIQTSPLWQTDCEDTFTITSTTLNDITEVNLANQPSIECTELTVDIGTPFLRRCFKNTYTVQYCNEGTQPAVDAYVEISFDEEIIPLSASIPFDEANNLLTFQLGEIGIGECGSFTVMDSVSCLAPLASTGCVEAHIYPDEYCIEPSTLWDGANLAVNAFCLNNDSVQFIIENIGDDMESPSRYKMYVEDFITVQEEISLGSGAAKVLNYPATGETYRVIVEQTPGHPSQDNPQAFFEFCGDGNFSTGFINTQLLPDKDEFLDIDCEEIIGSYDPNDKLVTPAGVGDSNDIYKGDELTYKIRFQNTGNDTAFTVVLVDTLDFEHLNVSTLEILNSSHPYTLSIEDAQILTFTFDNILLVDSTTNEPASHGFVSFKIDQFKGNAIGDVIENKAYIYFDYNEAIVTPTVFNTVAEPRIDANFQFIPLTVGVGNLINHLFTKVYPNPARGVFYVDLPDDILHQYPDLQLEMYNTKGQAILNYGLDATEQSVDISDLRDGMHYYKVFSKNQVLANGKLLIQ